MPATRLFVGNIPYSATEQQLRDLFASKAGAVRSVRLITDFGTGRSKGYGFVEMATPAEAERAIQELHGHSLGGRTLVVSAARPREPPPGPPRR